MKWEDARDVALAWTRSRLANHPDLLDEGLDLVRDPKEWGEDSDYYVFPEIILEIGGYAKVINKKTGLFEKIIDGCSCPCGNNEGRHNWQPLQL